MKKAGIITHYNVHNHGAHLQLFALIQELKKLGYNAQALQFQKNYDFMGGAAAGKKYNISLRSIPTYLKYTVQNGVDRTAYNIKKREILSDFRKKHDVVGAYYSEATDIDLVVIGSDEIFSIEAGPNPWYYGIGVPCKNQVSYAASFGPTTLEMINEHNMDAMVAAGINNIKAITVRDQNSADIVKHFSGKNVPIVCDPVLLHDFSRLFSKEKVERFRQAHPEKYCIVYSYDYNMNDDATVSAIRKYAVKRGLKVYSLGYFHKWCDENPNVSPLELFLWFRCADMVFTDTFHGSVISLSTEAQFISLIRNNQNKLAFLLKQYGVSERIVNDFAKIEEKANSPIDYTIVEITVQQICERSFRVLKEFIEQVKDAKD